MLVGIPILAQRITAFNFLHASSTNRIAVVRPRFDLTLNQSQFVHQSFQIKTEQINNSPKGSKPWRDMNQRSAAPIVCPPVVYWAQSSQLRAAQRVPRLLGPANGVSLDLGGFRQLGLPWGDFYPLICIWKGPQGQNGR